MIGIIGIDQLVVSCIIGVDSPERQKEQEIVIDLKFESDFSKCSATDSIQDTINYSTVAKVCAQVAQSQKYFLIESLANALVSRLIADFNATTVWIRISKPLAIHSAQRAFVELKRSKDEGR